GGGVGQRGGAAQHAAEKIAVEYEELAPVVAATEALKPGATRLGPEAPANLALDWVGLAKESEANAREVDEIIKSAAHVARLTQFNQRIFPAPMPTPAPTP